LHPTRPAAIKRQPKSVNIARISSPRRLFGSVEFWPILEQLTGKGLILFPAWLILAALHTSKTCYRAGGQTEQKKGALRRRFPPEYEFDVTGQRFRHIAFADGALAGQRRGA
jgi:hypothetical protein